MLSLLLLPGLLVTCRSAPQPVVHQKPIAQPVRPEPLRAFADLPPGLSGLTRDRAGRLCAIAEDGTIVLFDHERRTWTSIPLRGAEAGMEFESIVFLDGRRILVGTEVDAHRTKDVLLIAERNDDANAYVVQDAIVFDYALWEVEPAPDKGLEGICAVGDSVIVVAEAVKQRNGARFSPLGVYDQRDRSWAISSIRLTSRNGKIAGLSCRTIRGRVEFVAIERHFDVTRILRGQLADPLPPVVVPRIVYDWTGIPENLEGIDWSSDDRIDLVNDNFFRGLLDGQGGLYSVPLPDERE